MSKSTRSARNLAPVYNSVPVAGGLELGAVDESAAARTATPGYDTVHILTWVGGAHVAVFALVCGLVFAGHAKDKLLFSPLHYSVDGHPAWPDADTKSSPHALIGMLVAFVCYIASSIGFAWRPFFEAGRDGMQWPTFLIGLLGVGNGSAFVALAAFIGMTEVYELVAAALIQVACGIFNGGMILSLLNTTEGHEDYLLGIFSALVSAVPYILAILNLDGTRPFDGYGDDASPGNNAVKAGVWIWITVQLLGAFCFIVLVSARPVQALLRAGRLGPSNRVLASHSSTEYYNPVHNTIFNVLYGTGAILSWCIVARGNDVSSDLYAPIYHQLGVKPSAGSSVALAVGYILPIAWTVAFVLNSVPTFLMLRYGETMRREFVDHNDVSKSLSISLSNAGIFILMAIIVGVRGRNELVFLGGYALMASIATSYHRDNDRALYIWLGVAADLLAWVLVSIKMYAGDDSGVDEMTSGMFWGVFFTLFIARVVDSLIKHNITGAARAVSHKTQRFFFMRILHVIALGLVTGFVCDNPLYTESEANAAIVLASA